MWNWARFFAVFDPALLEIEPHLRPYRDRIVLEITETAELAYPIAVRASVRTLRDAGFRIALDDLGAGYAGLNLLALLEPDFVKLDMQLVRSSTDDRRVVQTNPEFTYPAFSDKRLRKDAWA